ncbi:MAG: gamma carbonic anhydrase family protein [Phycisphaerales bacterium]|nr:gamma carbonic anhydrase family protein [Phycisphaerales bacterium]
MSAKVASVQLGENVYIAPTSYVGGDVVLGDHCTIMHHVTVRGDIAPIRIGARSNVQDGAVLHTRVNVPLEIAEEVVIGHRAVVHCRRVGANSLIGIGAIVLDDAEVGSGCIVAAGAVVPPRTKIPDGTLYAGVPAKHLRDMTDADRAELARIVASYIDMGALHGSGAFPNVVPR